MAEATNVIRGEPTAPGFRQKTIRSQNSLGQLEHALVTTADDASSTQALLECILAQARAINLQLQALTGIEFIGE